jgi:2-polyprenyl-3-methyl-5-hydroxy-6-metoxy-1,4-benzoquinol methylase
MRDSDNYQEIKISGGDTGSPINLINRIAMLSRYYNLKGKRILDCGCGMGEYFLELMNNGAIVYGIEFNESKVATFKTKGVCPGRVEQGNIEHMNYKDEFFDCVFMNEVLEPYAK